MTARDFDCCAPKVWVVEGDDGEVYYDDPETGKPWTRDTAQQQAAWGQMHGQLVYAYQLPPRARG